VLHEAIGQTEKAGDALVGRRLSSSQLVAKTVHFVAVGRHPFVRFGLAGLEILDLDRSRSQLMTETLDVAVLSNNLFPQTVQACFGSFGSLQRVVWGG